MKRFYSILCFVALLAFSPHLRAQTPILENSFDTDPTLSGWIVEGDDLTSTYPDNWRWSSSLGHMLSGNSYSSTSTDQYILITPEIILDARGADYSFDYKSLKASNFSVYVLTNGASSYIASPSSAVAIESNLPIETLYTTVEGSLAAYVGQTIRLAFVHTNILGEVYLDNFSVAKPPLCLPAKGLTLSSLQTTSVTLNWTNSTTDAYKLMICSAPQATPAAPDLSQVISTTDINVTNNTYNVTGLTAGTTYYFYLRADCSSTAHGFGQWSKGVMCSTPCVAQATPYTIDFDTYSSGDNPDCWVPISTHEEQPAVYTSTSLTSPCYRIPISSTKDAMVILPMFTSNAEDLMVKVRIKASSENQQISVGLTNDITDASAFLTCTTQQLTEEWETYTFFLKNIYYTGPNYYIAFYSPSGQTESSTSIYQYIDNVEVLVAPDCLYPLKLKSSDVTDSSVKLEWEDKNIATSNYTIEYTTGGVSQTVDVNANPYVLSGLLSNSDYSIKIRANCTSTSYSAYTDSIDIHTFITPVDISQSSPEYVDGFEDLATSKWQYVLGNEETKWTIGTAIFKDGTSSMYPTSDLMSKPWSITTDDYSYSYAYCDFNFTEAGQYKISYDWKGNGSYSAYSKVVIIPTSLQLEAGTSWSTLPAQAVSLMGTKTRLDASESNAWENQATYYDVTTPGVVRVVLYWYNSSYASTNEVIAIDNFKVKPISCPRPSDFTYVSSTSTSATFGWTGTSSEYTVKLFPETHSLDSIGIINTNAIEMNGLSGAQGTVTGLADSFHYYAYLQANCSSADKSEWMGPIDFFTQCNAQALPYNNNFDSFETGNAPLCWTVYTSSTAALPSASVGTSSLSDIDGSKYLLFKSSVTDSIFAMLPEFDGHEVSDLVFSFDCTFESTTNSGKLKVGYVTDISDVSTFVQFDVINQTTTVLNKSYDLSTFGIPAGARLAFMYTKKYGSNTYSYYAGVDNLKLYVRPNCLPVIGLQTGAIKGTTASISWTSTVGNFNIEYGAKDFVAGTGTTVTASDNNVELTGLSELTEYTVRVQSNCGSDQSTWEELSFKTGASPADATSYNCDFEDPIQNSAWQFANDLGKNGWEIGSQISKDGSNSLYIVDSNDLIGYAKATTSRSWIYRTFTCIPGQYIVEFDWLNEGESNYDYVQAVITPDDVVFDGGVDKGLNNTSVPDGWITISESKKYLSQQPTWKHQTINFTVSDAKDIILAFYWKNDGSGGTNPGAQIDNVTVSRLSCADVTNFTQTALTTSTAKIVWQSDPVDHYKVRVASQLIPEALLDTVTQNVVYSSNDLTTAEIDLSGLTSNTNYYVYVKNLCTLTDSSKWSSAYTFTTPCSIKPVPYLANFNSDVANTLPSCWGNLGDVSISVYSYIKYGSDGNSLRINPDDGETAQLVSPQLELVKNIDEYQVSFYAYLYDSKDDADVHIAFGQMDDLADNTTFSELTSTITLANSEKGKWKRFVIPFTHPLDIITGQPKVLTPEQYFVMNVPGECVIYIDEFKIEEKPACAEPYDLLVKSITSSGCTFDWAGTAASFQVSILDNDTDGATAQVVTANEDSLVISTLNPHTNYALKVRAICSAVDTSAWTDVLTFTTECSQEVLPFTEDFDDVTTELPVCWSQSYSSSFHVWEGISVNSDAHHVIGLGTSISALSDYTGVLTSPELDLTSISNALLSFDGWTNVNDNSLECKVFITNTAGTLSDTLETYTNMPFYTHYQLDLAPYVGQIIHVNFFAKIPESSPAQTYVMLDNVSITADKYLEIPTGISLNNITSTSVEVQVTADPEASAHNVYIIPEIETLDVANHTPTVMTDPTTVTVTGLNPSTNYKVYVQAISGSSKSLFADAVHFSTDCEDAVLPLFETFEDSKQRIPLCWTDTGMVDISLVQASAGVQSLRLKSKAVFISPRMVADVNTMELFANIYSAGSIEIGVCSDPTQLAATYTLVETINATTNFTTQYNVDFTSVTAGNHYIVIVAPIATSVAYIDNLQIVEASDCDQPENVELSSMTDVSAEFTVTDADASSFDIAYGPAESFSLNGVTPQIVASASTVSLSGLTSSTNYVMYVRSTCSADSHSAWFGPVAFRTNCGAYVITESANLTENFSQYRGQNEDGVTLPDCWSRLNSTDNKTNPYAYIRILEEYNAYYKTTSYYEDIKIAGTSSDTVYLIAPEFANPLSEIIASVGVKGGSYIMGDDVRLEVGAMSNPQDASTFITLGQIDVDALSSYTFRTQTFDLRYLSIPADYHYIAVRAYGDDKYFYLDNFKFEQAGNCAEPIDINALNITQSEVDLSAKCVSNASRYELVIFNNSLAYSDTIRNILPGTSVHLSGLQTSTEYKVKARSFCANVSIEDTTIWSDVYRFYTLQVPAAIPYVCSFEDATENRNWTSMSGGLSNYWMIGSGFAKDGSSSLFVTNDGINPDYNETYTFIWAYRLLTFERSNYDISFYARAGGNSSNFLRVFLIPADIKLKSGNYYTTDCEEYNGVTLDNSRVPDRFIEITDGYFSAKNWTEVSKSVAVENAGDYRLAFLWRGSSYGHIAPSALIDSIAVTQNVCPAPINLAVINAGKNSVTVTAQVPLANAGDQIRYVVIPKDSILSEPNVVSEITGNTGDTVVISGLESTKMYKIYAAKLCGSEYSDYTDSLEFATLQDPAIIPYVCDFEANDAETSRWQLLNDDVNAWVIDTIISKTGKSSLYVSNNNGVSNQYTVQGTQNSFAYRSFELEAGEFNYEFDWLGKGESTYDYTYMFVLPSSVVVPSGGSTSIGGVDISTSMSIPSDWYQSPKLNLNITWKHQTGSFVVATPGIYNVVFVWHNDVSGGTNPPTAIDSLVITKVSCPKPAIQMDQVGTTSATASWTQFSPKVHAYLYDVNNSSSPVLKVDTVTTESSVIFNGLSPNTSYKLVARSLCSATDSSDLATPVLFTTDCAIRQTPFTNDFDATPLDLDCWTKYLYLIDSDVTYLSDLVPTSSSWIKSTDGGSSQHLYVNIYGTTKRHWIVSPSIEVTPNDFLKFDVAYTKYGSLSNPTSVGSDDVFAVMISRDNGNTWTSLQTWDQEATTSEKLEDLSNVFTNKSFVLTSEPLDTVKVAFYAASSVSNADNNIRVDNVSISCVGDTVFVTDDICAGIPYTRNGFNIPANEVITGRYTTLISSNQAGACDYIKVLDLTVNQSYEMTVNETICQGNSYSFGGVELTTAGDYVNTLTSSSGCDSLVHLHLEVISVEVSKDSTICQGQSIDFADQVITTSGAYVDTVANAQGCDSITHLYVHVIPTNVNLTDTICEGDIYTLGTQRLTTTGIYQETLLNRLNCDSIITLDLTVMERDSIMTDHFCEGSSYNFRGVILTTAGVYTDTLKNFYNTGCDRVYVLTLSETKPDTVYISDQFCEGDVSYNNYGFGIDNPVTGQYQSLKQSLVTSCDSLTILTLTEIATVNTTDAQSICDGNFLNWGGQDYGTAGVYTHTFVSSAGCDSIVELTLSVNPTYELDVKDTIQYSRLPYINLDLNVPTGTSPGDYQFQANGKTRLGCDSLINIDLHIIDNVGLNSVTMNELVMYPTSVKTGDVVSIQTDFTASDKEGMTIQLYNAVGKVIKQYIPQEGTMKFNMPTVSGIYYMHINLEDGRAYVGKIVVY